MEVIRVKGTNQKEGVRKLSSFLAMPLIGREAKYKKTVEAVYGEAGPNAHSIQSLQQYALMTPGKLPKIGKFVLLRAKDGLKDKKKGSRFVFASLLAVASPY